MLPGEQELDASPSFARPRLRHRQARRGHVRVHRPTLALLMLLSVARGLFWLVTTPMLYGDEPAQYAFIQSLATGHGIPVTGRSFVTADALALLKSNPAAMWRAAPVPPTPHAAAWGFVRQQYEGYQAPLYHLLMVPVYWLGRAGGGLLGSVYALRLASLLLIALAVPATHLLAREVFPGRREVWLLAPAVLVALQIVNSQAGIDNDVLTYLAGAVAVLVALRARHDLRARRGAVVGATLGLCALTKGTFAELLPALALALVAFLVVHRPPLGSVARWGGAALLGVAATYGPWLAFNLHAYGSLTGAGAQAVLVEPVTGRTPSGLRGMHVLLRGATQSIFVVNVPVRATDRMRTAWEVLAGVAGAGAMVGSLARRHRDAFLASAWLVVSIPLGALALAVALLNQAGGGAQIVGRHFAMVTPLFCVLVAYGAVALLGRRIGGSLLVVFLVALSFWEVGADRYSARRLYTAGVVGHSAPVVEQTYGDRVGRLRTVVVRAPCQPTAVALDVLGRPPSLVADGRPPSEPTRIEGWATYRLSTLPAGRLVLAFPSGPAVVSVAARVRVPSISAIGGGTPALRLYCDVRDPQARRFASLYRPDHPFPMTLGALTAWPEVEAEAGALLGAVAIVRLWRRPLSAPAARRS